MNFGHSKLNTGACLLAGLLGLALPLACSENRAPAPGADETRPAEQLWTCSMHPHVLQDEPGPCPICGMDLVPVSGNAAGDDAVRIDPAVVQSMGVRTARVQRQPLFRHIRTIGQVEVAEDLVSVVNLRFSGWIEKIHADKTGARVEAGDPLFEIYSPDLVAAQEEYRLALRSQGPRSELTRSALRKLSFFDLATRDIDAIVRAEMVKRVLPIRAPRSGYILAKNVVEGARVPAGQDLYTIGDLSAVWVQAEVYEHDAPWVEVGQPAQMELTHQRGAVVEGSVAYVYPTLNEGARTLTVRLEFPNPDLRLKPGMFTTVYIQFRREDDALALPTEAILHSGTREIVFVATGEGRFEPREITTGLVGDRHMTQVLTGLAEGEEVVVSGQFLIDSESQLQEAIAKLRGERGLGAAASGAQSPGGDEAEPAAGEFETIFACPMHPEEIAHEAGARCSICGMDLEERTATPEELARLQLRRHREAHDSAGLPEGGGASR